jgi:hypothetical protein
MHSSPLTMWYCVWLRKSWSLECTSPARARNPPRQALASSLPTAWPWEPGTSGHWPSGLRRHRRDRRPSPPQLGAESVRVVAVVLRHVVAQLPSSWPSCTARTSSCCSQGVRSTLSVMQKSVACTWCVASTLSTSEFTPYRDTKLAPLGPLPAVWGSVGNYCVSHVTRVMPMNL